MSLITVFGTLRPYDMLLAQSSKLKAQNQNSMLVGDLSVVN
jgi:hypothetical protein